MTWKERIILYAMTEAGPRLFRWAAPTVEKVGVKIYGWWIDLKKKFGDADK